MSKNKRISSFGVLLALFLAVAVILGLIFQTGANHPPMRFPDIGDVTTQFLSDMAKSEYRDVRLSLASQGPFKWDNKKDLGQSKILGDWSNEMDQDFIVYFRRDNDAVWQEKAQSIISSVDRIANELSDCMGEICCSSESANGRRLPIYLPTTTEEYLQVIGQLCDGHAAPSNRDGCSFISIGPLGCKNEGIVLNPELLSSSENVEYTLRKEIARYVYLSSLDYSEDIEQEEWFSDGILEFFAAASDTSEVLSEELISYIENGFELNQSKSTRKDINSQVGAAFLRYLSKTEGEDKVYDLIQESFRVGIDSVFSSMNLDFQKIKQSWLCVLQGLPEEKPDDM